MCGKIIIQVIAMYTKSFRGIRYIRKWKSILMLVSVLSLLSLSGCEQLFPDWYDSLSERGVCFNNLSNDSLLVLSGEMGNGWGISYPDTLLPERIPELYGNGDQYWNMSPRSIGTLWDMSGRNDRFEDCLRSAHDTLMVFVILKDTLDKYGWEDVRKNYRVAVRYELSSAEVRSIRYLIPYPPQPFIKDVKMYPSYSHFCKN
jgi:hypothetical protein